MRARLEPAPLPRQLRKADGTPYRIALVGPTGAGKTTTAAKLAVRRGLFGAGASGLLTLDTYRVGGMEQLATYAELADVPFEVVYDAREIDAAMKRLSSCDVVIIDTPGRSPASRRAHRAVAFAARRARSRRSASRDAGLVARRSRHRHRRARYRAERARIAAPRTC